MPKNIPLRDVPDDHAAWIEGKAHPGRSQNAFLLELITDAYLANQLSMVGSSVEKRSLKAVFTFIDLFAGIGGFFAGMAASGGKCVYTNEWDKYAAQTYKEWTQIDHDIDQTDIRKVVGTGKVPSADILCAGFPCQPFSIAGVSKKNALGRAHGFHDANQGNLFFAITDLVEELAEDRPKVLILENVKNLKSHDGGNTFMVISDCIEALNYKMIPKVIDAQHWVPQHRERIFMVCFDMEQFTEAEIASFRFPDEPERGPLLNTILEDEPNQKYMLTDKLWEYLQNYAKKHQEAGNGFGYGLVTGGDISRTISARYYKDGSEILVKQAGWRNPRRLTPKEAFKLMGFNEHFAQRQLGLDEFPQVCSDTQSYKQSGNSVSPMVVEAIGREVVKVLKKQRRRVKAQVERKVLPEPSSGRPKSL